jgi:hypothetical protein
MLIHKSRSTTNNVSSSLVRPIQPIPSTDILSATGDELMNSDKYDVGFRIRYRLFRLPSPPMDLRYEPPPCSLEDHLGFGLCSASVLALLPIKDARGESNGPFA